MRQLDSTDIAFISETYPAYTKAEVCNKLGISGREYSAALRGLGLTDTRLQGVRCPRLDWPSVWYAYTRCGDVINTALATGYSREAVRYALESMLNMPVTRRAAYWNRWAHKNGREEYTDDDLSVVV